MIGTSQLPYSDEYGFTANQRIALVRQHPQADEATLAAEP